MKEELNDSQKRNSKLSGSRKMKFEKALKKCPKLTVSDEKVVEFRRKGRK